jgi:hypothetical protein
VAAAPAGGSEARASVPSNRRSQRGASRQNERVKPLEDASMERYLALVRRDRVDELLVG